MKENPGGKKLLLSALIGLLGPLSAYFGLFMMLCPAFLGFVYAAWGPLCFGLSALVTALGVGLVFGLDWSVAILLVTLLSTGFILGAFLERQRPYRYGAVACAAVFVFFQYAYVCMPSILAGEGAFGGMQAYIGSFMEALSGAYEAAGMSLPREVESYVRAAVPEITIISILAPAMAFGFLDVLLCRALCLRAKAPALRPMAPLAMWKLPRSLLMGTVILALGGLGVTMLRLKDAGAICAAIECVLILLFALGGFAFTEFNAMVVRRRGRSRRALHYVLYGLLMPYSLFYLALLGVADLGFRLRDRYLARPGK